MLVGRPAKNWDESHPDWAPSLALGYGTKARSTDRYERSKKRRTGTKAAETDAATAASTQPTDPSHGDDVATVPDSDEVDENENETGQPFPHFCKTANLQFSVNNCTMVIFLITLAYRGSLVPASNVV